MNRSKGRGRPSPVAINIKHIVYELERALNTEQKYMINPHVTDLNYGEDALQARDGAARKLRFLKVWFDLSSQVFLTCINLLDRFLNKMKVKPTYLGCVSISCLYIASELHKCQVNPSELVIISQVKCKVTDLERMSNIIKHKLDLFSGEPPITAYNYLNYYIKVLDCAATQLNVKSQFYSIIQRNNLLTHLDVIMLDSHCASMRPSIVALALIQSELDRFLMEEIPSNSPPYNLFEMYQWLTVIYELQIISMIIPNEFLLCHSTIKNLLQKYDNNVHSCKRPRAPVKWRFSVRFGGPKPKPSENFYTNLFVIRE